MAPRLKQAAKKRKGGSARLVIEEPNPIHMGCVFTGPIQQVKFETFYQRTYEIQRFAHKKSLQELFIYEQVKTLFKNIGWRNLLNQIELSYKRYTCEFLSSVYLDHGVLHFRANDMDCELTEDQICDIINAPTENTFGPDDRLEGYNDLQFWMQITREVSYKASTAKASSILHPVLKVAHRIIASILYPRHETNTINSHELKLLYCMTRNLPLKPHFGKWLCRKLISLSHSTTGEIVCGGVVTLLAKYAEADIPAEGVRPLGTDAKLRVSNLQGYHIFRIEGRRKTWTIGTHKHPTVTIGQDNKYILELSRPTQTTDWLLTAVLEPQEEAQEHSSQDEDYNPQDDQMQGQHQTEEGGTSGAIPRYNPQEVPPYHDVYMTQFGLLNQNFTHLTEQMSNLNTNVSSYREEVQEYRRSTGQRYDNLYGMMSDIHHWTVNQPNYQHPPPGYDPYPYPYPHPYPPPPPPPQ